MLLSSDNCQDHVLSSCKNKRYMQLNHLPQVSSENIADMAHMSAWYHHEQVSDAPLAAHTQTHHPKTITLKRHTLTAEGPKKTPLAYTQFIQQKNAAEHMVLWS